MYCDGNNKRANSDQGNALANRWMPADARDDDGNANEHRGNDADTSANHGL